MANASITISIQPKSEDEAREIAEMKSDLEFIARRTTGGGPTSLFKLMMNQVRAKVREGIEPFTAIEQTTGTIAELVERNNPVPRR